MRVVCVFAALLLVSFAYGDDVTVVSPSSEHSSLSALREAIEGELARRAGNETVSLTTEGVWPPGSARGEQLLHELASGLASGGVSGARRVRLLATVRANRLVVRVVNARATSWWRRALGWADPGRRFEVALDAELRSYVASRRRLTAGSVTARRLRLPSHGYIALTVKDVDPAGGSEILLMAPDAVDGVRLERSPRGRLQLVPVLHVEAPPATRFSRRSFGTIAAAADGGLQFQWARRALVYRLDAPGSRLVAVDAGCPPRYSCAGRRLRSFGAGSRLFQS